MYRRELTYTDFDGEERTETVYFNFSEAELAEMELKTEGGMSEYLNRIVNSKNKVELVAVFKKLLLEAYGEKSTDGRRFIKSKELSEAFSQTPMYSMLFMEFATDTDKATEFFKSIIPQQLNQ
jgi:hypothetical protein